jgi:hypothetical protein
MRGSQVQQAVLLGEHRSALASSQRASESSRSGSLEDSMLSLDTGSDHASASCAANAGNDEDPCEADIVCLSPLPRPRLLNLLEQRTAQRIAVRRKPAPLVEVD